jgi:tyrosine-protein phosphatase SIW14
VRYLLKLCPLVAGLALASCGTVGQKWAGIDNFDQVSPTLYRGAQPTEEGFRTLAASGIKTVINLRDSDDSCEAQLVHDAGMAYVRMPLDAKKVTRADAERFLAVLDEAQGPVFVHCLVGRDRTGMAVAAYRLRVQGRTLEAALKDLNAHGHFWVVYPKVRAAIASLARIPAPMLAAGTVRMAAARD